MVGHDITKGDALFSPYRYRGQLYSIIYGQATPSVIGQKSMALTAHLLLYNFVSLIMSSQKNKTTTRKHDYKSSFSIAIHASRLFIQKKIDYNTVTSILSRYLTPIRPNRKAIRRKKKDRSVMSFNYRLS